MNKLERYSLHSGLKISKPFINDCFFPIIQDKYITFNSECSISSQVYDYWQEVIDLIYEPLKDAGISIIQLGEEKSRQYEKVYSIKNIATFNQQSFVIKKSLLHFNANNFHTQIAEIHETPIVSLFSYEDSSSFVSYNKNNKRSLIDSPKDRSAPSYNLNESPKTINKISPFDIASEILNMLDISNDLCSYKIFHLGKNYHVPTLEIVPDFEPSPNFLTNSVVNLRMDYHFDEKIAFLFSQNRKLGITTNQPLSEEFLFACKNSIGKVFCECPDSLDDNFLKNLKKYNIPYELFSRDEEQINSIRLKNIDEQILLYKKKTKNNLDISLKTCDDVVMKSSKILISKGNKYSSKAHWVIDKPSSGKFNPVIDTSDFWEDLDYHFIYKKEN